MTAHPTDAEISEIVTTYFYKGAHDEPNIQRIIAAARDRNRLEAENAKLREAYRREVILGICEPVAIHRTVVSYLCEACGQRWPVGKAEVHAPDCLARPSQLETDNGARNNAISTCAHPNRGLAFCRKRPITPDGRYSTCDVLGCPLMTVAF